MIKEIANMFDVMTPNINKIWNWYENNVWNTKDKLFELPLGKDEFLRLYR